MPPLDQGVRKEIIARLIQILPDLPIESGTLSYEAREIFRYVEGVLPEAGGKGRKLALEVKEALVGMIDDHPITDFAFEFLEKKFIERRPKSLSGEKLSEYLSDFDASGLAAEIVVALEALPARYIFSVPLSKNLAQLIPSSSNFIAVNSKINIVRVDEDFWARFSGTGPPTLGRLGDLYLRAPRRSFEHGAAVLQIEGSGFANAYGTTATVTEALLTAKAFFGLGLALTLFKPAWRFLNNETTSEHLTYHSTEGAAYIGVRHFDQGADRFLKQIEIGPNLVGSSPENAQSGAMAFLLQQVGLCLEDSSGAKKLRLAGRWFFDSFGSDDELTAFLQATIVLEVVLGPDPSSPRRSMPLSDLLANRCAYLISVYISERDHIIETFPKIYSLRSEIVHDGKARLSLTEKDLFYTLRMYCARVIAREYQLLAATFRASVKNKT